MKGIIDAGKGVTNPVPQSNALWCVLINENKNSDVCLSLTKISKIVKLLLAASWGRVTDDWTCSLMCRCHLIVTHSRHLLVSGWNACPTWMRRPQYTATQGQRPVRVALLFSFSRLESGPKNICASGVCASFLSCSKCAFLSSYLSFFIHITYMSRL